MAHERPDETRTLTDELALAMRARLGDPGSFAALVAPSRRRLMYYFAVRGLGPDVAEDCVQECLLRAWSSLPEYTGASPFAAWLFGIARHVFLQQAHQQQRHRHDEVSDDQIVAPGRDPTADLLHGEGVGAVRAALASLPERMQLALQLRFFERRSCEEIAEILGTTLEAVSPLIYRAKAALRERLTGERRAL